MMKEYNLRGLVLTELEARKLCCVLEVYFPELGTENEMNGGDVVDELCELYSVLPKY